MNESKWAKWERTRTKGFWYYVLVYWVGLWGASMIAINSIYNYFFSHYGLSLETIKTNAPIILIAGFVAGAAVWFVTEYRYQNRSGSDS